MEIALQSESKGILYEGYSKAFRQCIYEEGDVEGKNERYEFRCDYDLECCGRTCCVPVPTTVPLWLMIILIVLALILLLALCALAAWYLAKYLRSRPKKDNGNGNGKYAALRSNGETDDYGQDKEKYSVPEDIYSAYGRKYDSRGSRDGGGYGRNSFGRNSHQIDRIPNPNDDDRYRRNFALTNTYGRRPSAVSYSSDGGSVVRHGVHETVEESFKQEITYERPASIDSRELL